MTVIIGLIQEDTVYIGGDSAGTDPSTLSISSRKDPKVFILGPFIIGYTSSFRMGQLLCFKFDPPKQSADQDDYEYMVVDFIDALRKCFAENGYGKMTEKENNEGGKFLVGYNGKLYCVQEDFQVGIPAAPFDAVGCGADLALGAMFATQEMEPKKRIKLALKAASEYSAGVRAPYIIKSMKK